MYSNSVFVPDGVLNEYLDQKLPVGTRQGFRL